MGVTVNDLWDDMISLASRIYKTQSYGIYYWMLTLLFVFTVQWQRDDTDHICISTTVTLCIPHAYIMTHYVWLRFKYGVYHSSCLSDSSTFDALVPVFCSNGITNFSSEIKVTKFKIA